LTIADPRLNYSDAGTYGSIRNAVERARQLHDSGRAHQGLNQSFAGLSTSKETFRVRKPRALVREHFLEPNFEMPGICP
jgi:hypothetical protein